MKNILCFMSDERQKYLKEYLQKKGFDCFPFEKTSDLRSARIVILPIPSVVDGKIKQTDISEKDFVNNLNNDSVVLGFCLSNSLMKEELEKGKIKYFDVYENGGLAVSNAYATAQGVLKYILDDTKKLLHEMKILISGYGKTGKAICETLVSNKVNVNVLVRRAEYKIELEQKNINCFFYEEKIENGYDYIINTVAFRVIDHHILKTLAEDGKYLEIASKPYGVDVEELKNKNIQFEILPSLPSKAAPESAGLFMAQSIEKIIKEGKL